jgi:hypothetical protein
LTTGDIDASLRNKGRVELSKERNMHVDIEKNKFPNDCKFDQYVKTDRGSIICTQIPWDYIICPGTGKFGCDCYDIMHDNPECPIFTGKDNNGNHTKFCLLGHRTLSPSPILYAKAEGISKELGGLLAHRFMYNFSIDHSRADFTPFCLNEYIRAMEKHCGLELKSCIKEQSIKSRGQ